MVKFDLIRPIEEGKEMDIVAIEETYPDDYILILRTAFDPINGRGKGVPMFLCEDDSPLLKKRKGLDKPSDTMILQGRNLNPILGGFM